MSQAKDGNNVERKSQEGRLWEFVLSLFVKDFFFAFSFICLHG